jgi:hypothetical protein
MREGAEMEPRAPGRRFRATVTAREPDRVVTPQEVAQSVLDAAQALAPHSKANRARGVAALAMIFGLDLNALDGLVVEAEGLGG